MILVDWHALIANLAELGTTPLVVSVLEKILRPVLVYLFLVYALRKVGKRILAQLNPFDLVVLLTLSNTVQNAIIGNDTSVSGGVIGALSLIAVNAALVRIYYRGPEKIQRAGEDDICLIFNYQIQEAALRKLHINHGELTARAHERGFDDVSEVETAFLYPNGTIYMKGTTQDSARLAELLAQVGALRQEVALLRH